MATALRSLPAPRAKRASKRIMLFMHDFSRTGVVINAVRLANGLVKRGHRVHFLVCNAAGRENHDIDPGIIVHTLSQRPRQGRSRALQLLAAIPAIRRAVLQTLPCSFVSLGNHGHVPAMLALARIRGVRKMLRISNEPGHVGDGALRRRVRDMLFRWTVAAADRLILVSPHLANHRVIAAAQREGKVSVVPNGVAVDDIRQRACAAAAGGNPGLRTVNSVVAIGRLVPHKNFETLIRAVAIAHRERPITLTLIGDGKPEYRDRLCALAASLGIGERVRLIGEVADPVPQLAAADVFVLPSLWEGSSNVLLEALACGTPIVASRTAGDAPSTLDGGRFGRLVDPLDATEMAAAILAQLGPARREPGKRALAFDLNATVLQACSVAEAA